MPSASLSLVRKNGVGLGLNLVLFLALSLAPASRPLASPILRVVSPDNTSILTVEELEVLPQHTVRTANPYTEGIVAFRGPLARDVLKLFGLETAKSVRFRALNDYAVDIPTSDLFAYDVILALEADGRRLSRRERGPLWLIYPMTDHPELESPTINARLIWQVDRIELP